MSASWFPAYVWSQAQEANDQGEYHADCVSDLLDDGLRQPSGLHYANEAGVVQAMP